MECTTYDEYCDSTQYFRVQVWPVFVIVWDQTDGPRG